MLCIMPHNRYIYVYNSGNIDITIVIGILEAHNSSHLCRLINIDTVHI